MTQIGEVGIEELTFTHEFLFDFLNFDFDFRVGLFLSSYIPVIGVLAARIPFLKPIKTVIHVVFLFFFEKNAQKTVSSASPSVWRSWLLSTNDPGRKLIETLEHEICRASIFVFIFD